MGCLESLRGDQGDPAEVAVGDEIPAVMRWAI